MKKLSTEKFLESIHPQPFKKFDRPLTDLEIDQAVSLDQLTVSVDLHAEVGFAIDPDVTFETDAGIVIDKLCTSEFLSELKLKFKRQCRQRMFRVYIALSSFEALKGMEIDAAEVSVELYTEDLYDVPVVKHIRVKARKNEYVEWLASKPKRF